jgi:2-phosphosulfolactate phosphatase
MNERSIEVLMAPAEFEALGSRKLEGTVCVGLDVLRATSSMVTAMAAGAVAIHPAVDIPEALALRAQMPGLLLAGERDGLRICGAESRGVEFDFGNSPREFVAERVAGRSLVCTTTNGTRALRACLRSRAVLVGALLNIGSVASWIKRDPPEELLIVCGGTFDQVALEDVLAAGALCDRVWPEYGGGRVADAAIMARQLYQNAAANLRKALGEARNGRRLLSRPELAADVEFCARMDAFPIVPSLGKDGWIRVVD